MLRLENKWDSHLVLFTGSNGFTSQKNKPFTRWCVPRSHFQVGTAHSNLSWLTAIISGIRGAHICTLSMERLICREPCNRITSGWKTMFNVENYAQSNMVILCFRFCYFFLLTEASIQKFTAFSVLYSTDVFYLFLSVTYSVFQVLLEAKL